MEHNVYNFPKGSRRRSIMTEEELFETSEVSEESEESSATSSIQIQSLRISLAASDLWEELLQGKISLDEFKELIDELQKGMIEVKKRRRRRR